MDLTKFNDDYIDKYYHKKGGVYFRNADSPTEPQNLKNPCLKAVMGNLCDKDFFTEDNIPAEFLRISGPNSHGQLVTRCICSQREDDGLCHYIIEHKESLMQFCIGVNCFKTLFDEKYHQEVLDFNKESCKRCEKIIHRSIASYKSFCSKECKRIYGYESCTKCNIPKTTYEDRRWALCKMCKFGNKIYLSCEECGAEKCTPYQQKFKLCYNCKD